MTGPGDPESPGPPQGDAGEAPLAEGVAEHRRRKERLHATQGLAARLVLQGSLGWLVVVPALAGVWLGRWLDRRLETGVLWTGAGVMLGAGLGFALLFRAAHHDERDA